MLNAVCHYDDNQICFMAMKIAYPSFLSQKKNFFWYFYDWGRQDIVLVSSIFATTFKKVSVYEFHLKQCLETSGTIYNINIIAISR